MITLSRPSIGDEEIEAVVAVLRSGMLASGARVIEFEETFAKTVGCEHAVAVGSGTAALHVGLLAMGVGPGDEVIVPSFTFAATANAVRMVGAEPVFVDIDPSDYMIHADAIKGALTGRTRAVMPVHLYGQPAPMTEIMELTRDHGVGIVEDAAQAHLAMVDGHTAGAIGDFAAFSFYPTKNMTTGEGGMITTSHPEIAEQARMIRNQGMTARYEHRAIGINERMTEAEAAMGMVQLAKLEGWTARRREIAAIYASGLDSRLGLPLERDGAHHVYHQYTLAPKNRTPVVQALERAEIGYGVYYPKAIHQQTPYLGPEYDLPVTEEMTERVVSIPVRPDLTDAEIETIIVTLNGVYS